MSNENVALVRSLYEAFDRGDIPAVIAGLAENVSWNSPTVLPHGGIAHGHAEVEGFFGASPTGGRTSASRCATS